MMTTNQVTVVQIQDHKVTGQWIENSLQDAMAAVESLKISGIGKTFAIENRDGTVVEVIKL